MKISGTGAMVGAGIGAVARATVVVLNLGAVPPILVFPSAAIGVLVGLIAGASKKPAQGALIGAMLSAVVFELFMFPCVSLAGMFGQVTGDAKAGEKFFRQTLVYAMEMGVAGALAGGLGSWIGLRVDSNRSARESDERRPTAEDTADG